MASESEASTSRSPSPEVTPFATKSQHARLSTLSLATSTIDDLTLALTSFSSPPTPEPAPLACCCGRGDDCDATRSWNRVRAKLERGLTLSAEVGQALLQRHEAYVRKYNALEEQASDTARMLVEARERAEALQQTNDALSKRLDDMMHDYTDAEKRLGHALMSHDVSDSSNKALLQELDTARSVIERLSAQNARAVGWDMKLAASIQDADDLKAELDSERHRTKVAETKCSAAMERCAKLEADIHFAGEELEHLRATRSEFSQDILDDARARLRALQGAGSLPGSGSVGPTREVTEILETLVADNEVLKKDTAELQNLLAESREDNRILRDELEEAKAVALGAGPVGVSTPTSSTWYQQTSGRVTPSFRSHRPTDSIGPRSPGLGGLRGFRFGSPHVKPAPLDLEPDDSVSSHNRRQSQVTLEIDPSATVEDERPRSHRPLMLLTRERGVQTDVVATTGRDPVTITVPTPPAPGTSPRPSIRSDKKSAAASTPVDAYSETSSILDSGSSHRPTGSLGSAGAGTGMLGSLVTQMMALLQRLREVDVPTLSARLKRQQLLGAGGDHTAGAAGALAGIAAGLGIGPAADRDRQTRDVLGHLSRTTIDRVVREAGRVDVSLPQDETASVARREMRALLTLLREIFVELGRLKADINEIVLNPAGAAKFAEDVMNAEHVSAAANNAPKRTKTAPSTSTGGGGGGWIAPISKLFGGGGGGSSSGSGIVDPRAELGAQRPRTPAPRIVSKVGATVGASHTTAHVGFSKSGTRGVSTAWDDVAAPVASASTSVLGLTSAASEGTSASRVLELFAGAPQPRERDRDWVVLPRDVAVGTGSGTVRAKHAKNRLSRNLDALSFDGPGGPDRPEPGEAQVTRTLRSRGLSDSSIRSTFLADAERDQPAVPQPGVGAGMGMFGAFSKRVQGFAHYYPTSVSTSVTGSPVFASAAAARARSPVGIPSATAMPIPVSASARLLRGVVADSANSSVRDESAIERQISRGKNF
ncbi:hypothetical protein AURDEDRAFT_188345 [Auricularia subglabra TFB-10046 SS5]|nr:hypothetical protein AURDEDRAFT_188345 [Auricularia subglabra TFB-10046 SS5]